MEELGDIIKDLSDGDNDDSHDNKKNKDHCDDDGNEEEQETKLMEFHAKNYFNSRPSSIVCHGHWVSFNGYTRPQASSILSIKNLPFQNKTRFFNSEA